MKTIYIDANQLKAVRIFAAKQDIRYYLNGVLVQATAKQTRIVATDGTIVGVFDHEEQNEHVAFEEFIIPTDAIDTLKPDAKFPVRVTIDGNQYCIQQYDDRAFTFKPVEGRFPDYTRIVPEKVSGEPAQFSGDLLARIDKAQKIFGKKSVAAIWHNGRNGNALFTLFDAGRFIGVVMPYDHDRKSKTALPAPDTSAFRRALTVEKAEATAPVTEDDLL